MNTPTGQSPDRYNQSVAHDSIADEIETESGAMTGQPEPHPDQLDLFGADLVTPEASAGGLDPSDVLDLHRLEASIRWLQDQAAFRRLPRAAMLPPVRGLAAPDADANHADSLDTDSLDTDSRDTELSDADLDDTFMDAGASAAARRSAADVAAPAFLRDRERLVQPQGPRRPDRVLRGLFKFSLACAVAAAAAYGFAVLDRPPAMPASEGRTPEPGAAAARASDVATVVETTVVAKSTDIMNVAVKQSAAVTEEVNPNDGNASGANPNETNQIIANAADPVTPQDEAVVPQAHRRDPVPAANPDATLTWTEIAALIGRGRAYFDAGDVAAARLVFRRAANAGDAAAALAMGATYDPDVLARHLVRGMRTGTGANVDEARSWYERARELGSPEGPRRIEILARQ